MDIHQMPRRHGRCRRGERLRASVPHGHWKTTTVVAGLRRTGMVAPIVLDGPINRDAFCAYVAQVLVPELKTADTIAGARIQLDQSKTSDAVDVPVMPGLAEASAAGPLGAGTLIEARTGEPFTAKGFHNLMQRACIAAGLPHRSAHGLRTSVARRCRGAGCTTEEGMAITGHKTVKEYLRYAGDGFRGRLADATRG